MAESEPIRSASNEQFRQLREIATSARERRTHGRMLLDGVHLLECFARTGVLAEVVAASESGLASPEVRRCFEDTPARRRIRLEDRLFARLSDVATPSGVLALVPIPDPEPNDPAWRHDAVLLDALQDAGNVGTILRTAAAAGMPCVAAGPGTADLWSPKVLRAGMGAHFALRLRAHADLAAIGAAARGQVIAATGDGETDLYGLDLTRPTLWIFGSEGQGVSEAMRGVASIRARIPIAAGTESLNVAAAAAICLFEQRRQRSATITQAPVTLT